MTGDFPLCSKCLREIISGQGMTITSMDTGDEMFYCKACLRGALAKLSMKKNKGIDEIELLSGIRKFLKQKSN